MPQNQPASSPIRPNGSRLRQQADRAAGVKTPPAWRTIDIRCRQIRTEGADTAAKSDPLAISYKNALSRKVAKASATRSC